MVKHQIHEDFVSFQGASISELSKIVADYVVTNKVAAKSLSILFFCGQFIASIGYRSDEAAYPVSIESVGIALADGQTLIHQIDAQVNAGEDAISGYTICHSLYSVNSDLFVAFLVHG
jgi:hypothetical protein